MASKYRDALQAGIKSSISSSAPRSQRGLLLKVWSSESRGISHSWPEFYLLPEFWQHWQRFCILLCFCNRQMGRVSGWGWSSQGDDLSYTQPPKTGYMCPGSRRIVQPQALVIPARTQRGTSYGQTGARWTGTKLCSQFLHRVSWQVVTSPAGGQTNHGICRQRSSPGL